MYEQTNRQYRMTHIYPLLVTLLLHYSQLFLSKVQHEVYNSPRKTLLNCTLPYKRCILIRTHPHTTYNTTQRVLYMSSVCLMKHWIVFLYTLISAAISRHAN